MNTEGSLADAKAERVKLTKSLKVANSKLSKKQVASDKDKEVLATHFRELHAQ